MLATVRHGRRLYREQPIYHPPKMTLGGMLTEKETRDLFQRTFEFTPFNIDVPMKAPPVTNHYLLVGIAFDYLVRFWLGRHHKVAETRPRVAERSVNLLSLRGGEFVIGDFGGESRLIPRAEWEINPKMPDGCDVVREGTGEHDPAIAKVAIVARGVVRTAKTVVDLIWTPNSETTFCMFLHRHRSLIYAPPPMMP